MHSLIESTLALDSDACISYDVMVDEPLGGVPSASIVVQVRPSRVGV